MLSAGPTTRPTAAPPSQASNWDLTPQTGNQGYVFPLIDLYLNGTQIWRPYMRTVLQTGNQYLRRPFWMLPLVQTLIQQSESIRNEDLSCRETIRAFKSYVKWSFIPDHDYVCPACQDNSCTVLLYRQIVCSHACRRLVLFQNKANEPSPSLKPCHENRR